MNDGCSQACDDPGGVVKCNIFSCSEAKLFCSLGLKTTGAKEKGNEKSHPREEGCTLAGALERWRVGEEGRGEMGRGEMAGRVSTLGL